MAPGLLFTVRCILDQVYSFGVQFWVYTMHVGLLTLNYSSIAWLGWLTIVGNCFVITSSQQ